jgi:hypothetical protein
MKRTSFFALAILAARFASAQPWSYDASWSLPQTPATEAVRAALDRGLVAQPGVDFVNSLAAPGLRAVFVPAGSSWPCDACVQWYAKGNGADGKYQWPAADGPYPQGWEIRWDPNSWVNGQPTRWQFHPFSDPTFTPPPTPSPAPAPAPLQSVDLTPVLAKLDAVDAKLTQLAADEASFRDDVRSQSRKVADFAVKYIAPIVGAIVAGIAAK